VCNFSSGISGVWTRVLEDSLEFIRRGHEVHVFSSDREENGQEIEGFVIYPYDGLHIKRFPIKRKLGYAVWFDFSEEALDLKPDVIICHGLRKPYLGPAIKVAKELGIKCFLITHAPFIEKKLRSRGLNLIIDAYDKFIGKKVMNSFDKVIAICKWEKKELLRLGCEKGRIVYIPNSLSEDFFSQEQGKENKKIIFLGRMNTVKNIDVLIKAFQSSFLSNYILEIVSSKNGEYYNSLVKMSQDYLPRMLKKRIIFSAPVYSSKAKIKKIDSAEIFVLPSKKESLPFGIIEAMARGKIVVATKTKGALELIEDRRNGFLVGIGSVNRLRDILEEIRDLPENYKIKIKDAARKKAEEFKVAKLMEQWEELFVK